jgi:hypothetical protein
MRPYAAATLEKAANAAGSVLQRQRADHGAEFSAVGQRFATL